LVCYLAGEHFEEEDTESPPIDGISVRFMQQHLRRKVFIGATEGVGALAGEVGRQAEFLSEAKIGELDVSIDVEQYVLGFEVPIHDPLCMHVFEGEEDFCGVESCPVFGENLVSLQVREELAALNEVEDLRLDSDVPCAVESVFERHSATSR
jgi:hypothetical protein